MVFGCCGVDLRADVEILVCVVCVGDIWRGLWGAESVFAGGRGRVGDAAEVGEVVLGGVGAREGACVEGDDGCAVEVEVDGVGEGRPVGGTATWRCFWCCWGSR